jgi:SAM-dependent methyltransferase
MLNMPQAPVVFDRMLLRQRCVRAAKLGPTTFLIERVARELAERLDAMLRRFELAADIGTPTDAVRRAIASKVGKVVDVVADEEALPFRDGSLDLVVSVLALQFVNDLPGTLLQIRRALKSDGLFLAAVVGGDSLSELRAAFAAAEAEVEGGASPRIGPFADLRDVGTLLQRAGFALPVADVDRLMVRYASPLDLMHDLRRMGATNVLVERRRTPLRRATLRRLIEIYTECYAGSDGRVPATFEIIWLSGWAPHESQQRPLAPGSAKSRLADALRTREISAGDKTGQ